MVAGALDERPDRAGGCAGLDEGMLSDAVTATHWFDSGDHGKPYSVAVRFTGRRIDVVGKPSVRDRFDRVEKAEGVIPGSGPVALTTRILETTPGEWVVSSEPLRRKGDGRLVGPYLADPARNRWWLRAALWSSGTGMIGPASSPARVKTRMAALSGGPGVITGSWPVLVGSGVAVGLVVQMALVARMHRPVGASLLISLLASVGGLVGAKIWYLALRKARRTEVITQGLCIQGFVLGVAVIGGAALAALRMPAASFADAAAPGLFLGMAIGRPGCFLTGCCSGRPTSSRFGLWSSDGRLAIRRVPTQLMESAIAMLIGLAALVLVMRSTLPVPGALFVGALAAYTVGRQVLLPLRAEPRQSSIGGRLTMAAAALVLGATTLLSALGAHD